MIRFSEKQLLLDIKLQATPSLDNFVSGRNFELIQTLKNMLLGHEKERFIYVWGDSGCGKSHLLQAAVRFFIQSGEVAYYCPGEMNQLIQLSDGLCCVAIDDVESLDNEAQLVLFSVYNQFKEAGSTILLVSGSLPPMQLNLRRDLVTRLAWGLVYQVHELSEAEKIDALQKQAAERGFVLENAVCRYLLQHAQRDLSSLMIILDALDRFSLVHQRHITIPLLRKLLNNR
ncbi:DnaA regulatory inactivator Hda [Nitrosomonas sp.]|uniref:DnaA regulatory inactivator Hda n=1 Tax=Nitrosomonas sp. TaxID=42353 RepID=UPI002852880E|nr:DnaA regulatory inactivator Hda [Nitrosomonas sp.]MCP5243999.1 DnaA regulatory inactivator Hda [Burkholderiales bacterium]